MASNITNAPKRVNGVANEIFNAGDFAEASNDDKYLKKTGGVLSGSLTVPSLITNGGITLQSIYPSFPTQTQLGGRFQSTTTTNITDSMRVNNVFTYNQLSLPAGSYVIFYHFNYINNVIIPRVKVDLNHLQGGISFSFNGSPLNESKNVVYGYRIELFDGNNYVLNGSTSYQHNNTTNQTLYQNCLISSTGIIQVLATLTAVRIA